MKTTPTATELAIQAGINSLNHLLILELVAKHGPENMTRLSELANVSTAAMTGACDVMEKQGLLERVTVPGDRRKLHIQVTTNGAELVRAMRAANEAEYRAADAAAELAKAAAEV